MTDAHASNEAHFTLDTGSVCETHRLGETLGRSLPGGVLIGLTGPLGAGKTQLVKGIAVGNAPQSASPVTSPTFSLVHEYPGRLHLFHVDAYRLRQPREFAALGFDEWTHPGSAVVIEWADKVRTVLPREGLWIEIGVTGETTRRIAAVAVGESADVLLDAMRAAH
ncbi:MAG: tRNA (adenosine(37)-N6)-threonylcarbamoyltransferase complex ATPase subunit type 1 TsaE [Phycisphaerae bacterium]